MTKKGLPMAEVKETKTKAQRALELKQKLSALTDEAKAELLETVHQTISDLADLGFVYRLIEEDEYKALTAPKPAPVAHRTPSTSKSSAPKAPASPTANFDASKTCSVCKIPGHDGRLHRVHKDPFTPAELAERGIQEAQSAQSA